MVMGCMARRVVIKVEILLEETGPYIYTQGPIIMGAQGWLDG